MKSLGSLPQAVARLFTPSCMIRADKKLSDDYDGRQMYRTFFTIAWPALLESVLIGIISFVDTLMVSSVGEAAIAAVGLTNQPKLIFYVVFMSMSIGVNSVVARRRGQKNREGANTVLRQTLPLVLLTALVFLAVSYFLSEPLLRFAGAKADTLSDAVSYFRIIMLGMVFTSVSLTINAAQRGCGKTRVSMTTNLAANVVNVVFNALLINGLLFFPKLGVTGAAIATALGNFTAMVISIRSVRRKDGYLFLRFRSLLRFRHDSLPPVFRVMSGSIVEQISIRIGFFVVAKLIAELGTIPFATHQIGMTVLNLVYTVGDGLSVATSSLVGQNLGKKRPDHALVYGKIAQRIGWIFSGVILTVFLIFRSVIIGWFTDDPDVLHTGSILMIVIAVVSVVQIQQVLFAGCLRGAGDSRYMAVVSLISVGVLRPLLTFVFTYPVGLGVLGAWVALLADQIVRFIFTATRFYSQKWSRIVL